MNKTCSTVFISFAVFPRKIRVDATSFRITLMRRVRKVGSRILLKFEKKNFFAVSLQAVFTNLQGQLHAPLNHHINFELCTSLSANGKCNRCMHN
jgi:hypothetical protein